MYELKNTIESQMVSRTGEKSLVVQELKELFEGAGYIIAEQNNDKPWGAYFRFDSSQADRFVEEFFPGLTASEARLGNVEAELSPKILIVTPGERLSWQYHNRRAERWVFLTKGAYSRSASDEASEVNVVEPGHVVQFGQRERHRGVGIEDGYTVVAEIWQHVDSSNLSNEEDIVRVQDDYQR